MYMNTQVDTIHQSVHQLWMFIRGIVTYSKATRCFNQRFPLSGLAIGSREVRTRRQLISHNGKRTGGENTKTIGIILQRLERQSL